MQQLIATAMESSTSHALPRMVTKKPLYVRIVWLLLFLFMLSLFLKGFSEFIVKLQSRQVTTSLEVQVIDFQFPDVYVCFENPVSGSYSANIDPTSAREINAKLNATTLVVQKFLSLMNSTGVDATSIKESDLSFVHPLSLPYALMVDALGHREEQDVINSGMIYKDSAGTPAYQSVSPQSFFHPLYLRCFKWSLNSTLQTQIVRTSTSSGLAITMLIDTNSSGVASNGVRIQKNVFAGDTLISVSDWTLHLMDFFMSDRPSGVRVFLTPPGEYPSDFVTSFSLSPGKHHTVEIDMTQQVYKDGQFGCLSDAPDVQFVNPYDQTPYNQVYSYSYCYYYEYHRQFQTLLNLSGDVSPIPWTLRGKKYLMNLTGDTNYITARLDPSAIISGVENATSQAQTKCESKRPCSTLDYSVSISSADWPTQSSLAPFVSSSIKQAWTSAKAKNLSVPALDFLLTGNASSVASYVRSNLLKVHFKPHKVLCDRVTFSKDYTLSNFISDIGGIMGIYLGMSLLTLCELLELIYDLVMACCFKLNSVQVLPTASASSLETIKIYH